MSAVVVGPQSYANFHAFANGDARLRTEEVNLYSDGRFSLEWRNGRSLPVSVGPVTLIAMERPEETTWGPAIVMRYAVYYELPEHHDFEASSTSQYTGSSPYDQIACLLSLQYGARLMAGGRTRLFSENHDPMGFPIVDYSPPNVYISGVARRPVLPWVSEGVKRVTVGDLPQFGCLAPMDARTLLCAARSYRDALWLADTEPQLAWLLLVSAVEVVAKHAVPEEADQAMVLRNADPKLAEILDGIKDDAVAHVARHLAPLLKSTKRFVDFFKRFHPPIPQRRPSHDLWRLDPWDEPAMEKALRIVYQHRSKALHEAIPFPDPMCEPPMVDSQEPEAPCEIITGYSMSSSTGGSWPSEKMPFGLHLFEYIVRTSLLAWWKSVTPDAITNAETAGDSNSSLQ